jgi:hypothetical protein
MGSRLHKPGPAPGKRRLTDLRRLVGFLTIGLGFLTGLTAAAPLDDAIQRLERLEEERTAVLSEADSLGAQLARLPSDRGGEAKEILRQAERLGKRSADLEVEILLARQGCRTLALQELESIRRTGTSGEQEMGRELALVDLLQGRLSDLLGGNLVLVEPDTLDGYETLLDKQAYLQDLRDRVAALDSRLADRMDRARREMALREASAGFADEARFLDEGGRIGSDETARLRGTGAPDGTGAGSSRIVSLADDGTGSGETDPSAPAGRAGASPTDPLATLSDARARLARDLNLVSRSLDSTEKMLRRFGPEAR